MCLQCVGKGASRSLGSTLNSNRERGRPGEAEGSCGGRRLPLMVAESWAGAKERRNDRIEKRVYAALIGRLERVGRGRERLGATGIATAPDRARQRRGEEERKVKWGRG
jgi:hypothetical protein